MLEIGFPGLIEGVGQIGVIAMLLCFFVWQSSKEKTQLSERISQVEDFQKGELSGMVRETTKALTNSTKAVEDNSHVMNKLCSKLDGLSTNNGQA